MTSQEIRQKIEDIIDSNTNFWLEGPNDVHVSECVVQIEEYIDENFISKIQEQQKEIELLKIKNSELMFIYKSTYEALKEARKESNKF